jgi:hypothetical protein
LRPESGRALLRVVEPLVLAGIARSGVASDEAGLRSYLRSVEAEATRWAPPGRRTVVRAQTGAAHAAAPGSARLGRSAEGRRPRPDALDPAGARHARAGAAVQRHPGLRWPLAAPGPKSQLWILCSQSPFRPRFWPC